jgi:hypothetical protein
MARTINGQWTITQSNGFEVIFDIVQEPDGRLSGVTFDIDNPGSQATWFAHKFEPT